MLPTVAQVLALDVVRRARPRVLAAPGGLDRPVRWVHAIELPDAARLPRGGELVLAADIALPGGPPLLEEYVASLARVGVSALAVALGRRHTGALPPAFVAAAKACDVPLIVLGREVPFTEITETVHARIIDSQLEESRAAARLHEVFTDLAVAGAGPGEIIRQAARLAGRPVILADLAHHVLVCEPAGADPATLLLDFESRSRAAGHAQRTAFDAASGWLVTTVGARGEDWGRVVLVCSRPPSAADRALVERTATTLALGRLLARQQESLERQAHRTLLGAIMGEAGPGAGEAAVRARALGVPVTGRQLIAAVIRFRDDRPGLLAQARVLDVAEAVADACRGEGIPALVGSLDDTAAGALLSVAESGDGQEAVAGVCAAVRRGLARRARRPYGGPGDEPVIGVGSTAPDLRTARRSLLEARQVADAASMGAPGGAARPFYRLADLRLRGLLHLLSGDARVHTFVERELGPLLAYDADHGSDLTGLLGAYLAAGGNKAEAAGRSGLARPTVYERLRHVERILGVSLGSAESRASLHVALLARESARGESPLR